MSNININHIKLLPAFRNKDENFRFACLSILEQDKFLLQNFPFIKINIAEQKFNVICYFLHITLINQTGIIS